MPGSAAGVTSVGSASTRLSTWATPSIAMSTTPSTAREASSTMTAAGIAGAVAGDDGHERVGCRRVRLWWLYSYVRSVHHGYHSGMSVLGFIPQSG